ncbi:brix domain protein [Onchocerca flexuosa]|uniref:Brix domain protein n=1 Tax=Onchocerca flexuosa TaxID=387005 RepID=A0A238C5A8_9BILA|nr:brix domain protein [Onchocerca flexuosa]
MDLMRYGGFEAMKRKRNDSTAAQYSKKKHPFSKQAKRSSNIIDFEKHEENMMKQKSSEETERKLLKEPHSIVIHRGKVGQFVRSLEHDMRAIMEPFTASKLKVMKRNNLKDFIVNGAVLGVTHLLVLTRGENSITLRIIRSPQGPTLSFRIKEYTLARHIISASKRKMHFQRLFISAPLVVMSGFNSNCGRHVQLVQSIFQNMFPTVNVDTVDLSTIRRCILINYSITDNTLQLRHYAIKAIPAGLSKSTKKLIQSKVPDLSKYKNIEDYFLNPGQISESEYEFEQKEVELPQQLTTRGCLEGQKTNIRLYELGPRLTLQLMKIEEGVDEGEVLYHAYIIKSPRELIQLRKELPKKKKLKKKIEMKNEQRVIHRLKTLNEKKAKLEETLKQEREKLVRKQKEITGDEEFNDRPATYAYD